MIQADLKITTFEEFVEWLPENFDKRYELRHGNIIEMPQPVGKHEEIKGFLNIEIAFEIKRLGLPFSIPNQVLVRPEEADSGYFPDVLVINRDNLVNEPRWKKESIINHGASIPLVIEIVSSNWRIDYYSKLGDYEEMGIAEYWIVDYAALGSHRFIGNPKQPTISICNLRDGEYQINPFQNRDRLLSSSFPELNLTVEQVFQASN